MSKAYKCDICNSFYDENDILTLAQTENPCNYIKLNNCINITLSMIEIFVRSVLQNCKKQ